MTEQQLSKELLDAKIEGAEEFIRDMEEMLETDDSIPPAAMEVYERNLDSSKKRLEGLKGFRNIIEDLDG